MAGKFARFGSSIRRFVTAPAGNEFKSKLVEEEAHAGSTWLTWRKISFFVAVPAILGCAWNAWKSETEHHATHERPEFVAYPHLHLRHKPFPWGDGNHSLFHNSHTNSLPDGYEDGVH
eukprot:gene13982-15440_t